MDTENMAQEQISALTDGELADNQIDGVLAALHQPGERTTWEVYHHLGDVLRSEEMAFTFSPGFAARMAARLDAEPAIVAPKMKQPQMALQIEDSGALFGKRALKRMALPGLAAAAVAMFALTATPQLMVAMKGSAPTVNAPIMVASVTRQAPANLNSVSADPQLAATTPRSRGVILRDPRIEEYLLAHQRFSPSVYSTVQYARSATFATDSDK